MPQHFPYNIIYKSHRIFKGKFIMYYIKQIKFFAKL